MSVNGRFRGMNGNYPAQSLMKDQVDNLEKKGIADAVAIIGLRADIDKYRSSECDGYACKKRSEGKADPVKRWF